MCGPSKPDCGCHRDYLASQPTSSGAYVPGAPVGGEVYPAVRFAAPPVPASPLRAVGFSQPAGVPSMLPGQQIHMQGNLALYEDLYGAVDAYNNPAVAAAPGTWGTVFAAGRAR